MTFPVPQHIFEKTLIEYAIFNEESDVKIKGRRDLSRKNLGFIDGKLRFFRINFKAKGIEHLDND
jgi:hypothetical protein